MVRTISSSWFVLRAIYKFPVLLVNRIPFVFKVFLGILFFGFVIGPGNALLLLLALMMLFVCFALSIDL